MSWTIDYMDAKRDDLDFIVIKSAFLKIEILI